MNHYETLGVSSTASIDEIKQAYRRLAKKFHPDKNAGDETAKHKFQQIQEAYSILGDTNKKNQYDNSLNSAGDIDDILRNWYSNFNNGSFADQFNATYGMGRNSKGPNVKVNAHITLDDIYKGLNKTFDMSYDRIVVNLPKGLRDGMQFRITGRGEYNPYNREAPRGDLIVTINVIPDSNYITQGDDIWVETSIKFYDMILGTDAVINTPTGRISFKVPPSSHPGKVLRIAGKGLPIINTEISGAILVKLNTTFADLNDSQIELINKVKEAEHVNGL